MSKRMHTIIAPAMNNEQVTALFERECLLIGERDVVPLYRVTEIFGEWAAQWFDQRRGCDKESLFVAGLDWNQVGSEMVLYKRGFRKIASENNAEIIKQHTVNVLGGGMNAQ